MFVSSFIHVGLSLNMFTANSNAADLVMWLIFNVCIINEAYAKSNFSREVISANVIQVETSHIASIVLNLVL